MGLLDSILSLLGNPKPKETRRPQGPGLQVGEAAVRKEHKLGPTTAKQTKYISQRKDKTYTVSEENREKAKPKPKAKKSKPKGFKAFLGNANDVAADVYGSVMPQPLRMEDDGSLSLNKGEAGEALITPLMFPLKGYKAASAVKASVSAATKKAAKESVESKAKSSSKTAFEKFNFGTKDTVEKKAKTLTRKLHKQYTEELKRLDETPATDPATMERRAHLQRILSGEKVPPPTRKGYTSGGRPDHPNRPRPA